MNQVQKPEVFCVDAQVLSSIQHSKNYARLWRRTIAFGIDLFILWCLFNTLSAGLYVFFGVLLKGEFIYFVISSLYLLYFARMESSNRMSTIGKRMLGLKVTDVSGNRILFRRAIFRYLAKCLSGITMGLGYILPLFSKEKRALHDYVAGTFVILDKPQKKIRVGKTTAICILTFVLLFGLTGDAFADEIQSNSTPFSRLIKGIFVDSVKDAIKTGNERNKKILIDLKYAAPHVIPEIGNKVFVKPAGKIGNYYRTQPIGQATLNSTVTIGDTILGLEPQVIIPKISVDAYWRGQIDKQTITKEKAEKYINMTEMTIDGINVVHNIKEDATGSFLERVNNIALNPYLRYQDVEESKNSGVNYIDDKTKPTDINTNTEDFKFGFTTTESLTPVITDNSSKLAAGVYHTLAIKSDGTLWAWGCNEYGQLGDGTTTDRLTPVPIMNGVKSVAACDESSFAIKEDGTLWAWGANGRGQLGIGTTSRNLQTTPVQANINQVKSIAVGFLHSLAIKEDGTLWAWGDNEFGQLCDGTTMDKSTPVQVMSGVKSVEGGAYHTLIIKEDGTLWACGGNDPGLGDGTTSDKSTPEQIMRSVMSVASNGTNEIFVIKKDGTLWGFGNNKDGRLGDGTTVDRLTPVQVMSGVKSVATGGSTVVIKEDGTLWAWGYNDHGQLGDGTTTDRLTPVQVKI